MGLVSEHNKKKKKSGGFQSMGKVNLCSFIKSCHIFMYVYCGLNIFNTA